MIRLSALAASAAALALSACSSASPQGMTPTGPATMQAGRDVHPFAIGALQAYALRDGALQLPNDNKTVAMGRTKAETAALLTGAGLSGDLIDLSIQPLLVRDGSRLVLIDTGAGGWLGTANLLPASLRAAGVAPGQVTDILISHGHGDHVGGLVDAAGAAGAAAFPNAVVHIRTTEWAALQADPAQAALVAAVAPRVRTFERNARVLPNITAVAAEGHTPGHTAFEIASGGEKLLYIGDTAHHSVISVQRPDWTIAFDADAPAAQATRKAFLKQAAERNTRLFAVHFPFPGLGRVTMRGDETVWIPETSPRP